MIVRPSYPREFSIGLLLIIFAIASFLSFGTLVVRWRDVMEGNHQIVAMLLSGLAVVFMALILWEEFLFPIRIRSSEDEIIFRNHFAKLHTQALFYCAIPVIIVFIYLNYEVSPISFSIWALICLVAPVGKIISGIKNYNDFLKLTNDTIEFKNNEKAAVLPTTQIQQITLIKDDASILHKVNVQTTTGTTVMIDLDEMELEDYRQVIEKFIVEHYMGLVSQK